MSDEINQVKKLINTDFAELIRAQNVDYRVIMISLSMPHALNLMRTTNNPDPAAWLDTSVCVPAPLGATECKGEDLASLENPPRFFHYSWSVDSPSAWCVLLDQWAKPDFFQRSKGWSEWLRPNAFKNFLVISDDDISCLSALGSFPSARVNAEATQMAANFDAALLALSPEQFGSKEQRQYRFHSIVGLAANNPTTQAWPPTAPLQNTKCGADVITEGISHQAISVLTGGLRYPLCERKSFDAIFRAISQSVVQQSFVSCEWRIPAPPSSQALVYDRVNLQYHSATIPEPQTVAKVSDASACSEDGGWYYDRAQNPEKVVACPSTCSLLKSDEQMQVEIAFGCATKVAVK